MVDFLVVGQGLAGTLITHFLQERGKTVRVVDPGHVGAASTVAAGLINPVTGRRYVKSWYFDQLWPAAKETYLRLEQQLDISFFHPRPIIRTLFNHREENDWHLRMSNPAYQAYISEEADPGRYKEHTIPAYSYGELRIGAQVDLATLIRTFRKELKQKGLLLEAFLDYDLLEINDQGVSYKDIEAGQVVFCEGYRAAQNPYFDYLPFGGAKGEVLIVKIPGADFYKLFKHRIFIVPLGEDLYWIGSAYEWKYEDDQPTETGRNYLLGRLEEVLQLPFEVIDHRAAIRPTVKDRRPFLGRHPKWPVLSIFNGLGTKGASLGPFFARQMVDFLLDGTEVDPAVSITHRS
jgi:glycine oxidase